jgi:predicted TPR repeat methyltransferase
MSEPDAESERELSYTEAAELAFVLHTQRRFEESEMLYRQLLHAKPDDQNVLHYLGVLMHQTERHAEALELIERSLAADDGVAAWHNNYGNLLLDADRFDEAAAAYRRCAELDPGNVEVLCNLGVMYRSLKQFDSAEQCLKQALAAQPNFANAYLHLATLYWQTDRFDDAHVQTVSALKLFPRNTMIRKMLGSMYGQLGRLDDAAEVYREWLALEPDSLDARHHLAGCTGVDVPERAQDPYVEGLFDRFAESFDAKLAALEYHAPQLVGDAVARLLPQPNKALRVLDAGCGTGLCGAYLAPYARELEGVDLSANMIDRARARNLYDSFVKAELVGYIESVTNPFDVIVSADTLCYFGRLDRMTRGARRALRAGGLLIFTVEARTDGADYHLHPHGRYSHRPEYVRATLEQAGFDVRELTDVVLRFEAGRPVAGLLAIAEAAPTLPTH